MLRHIIHYYIIIWRPACYGIWKTLEKMYDNNKKLVLTPVTTSYVNQPMCYSKYNYFPNKYAKFHNSFIKLCNVRKNIKTVYYLKINFPHIYNSYKLLIQSYLISRAFFLYKHKM